MPDGLLESELFGHVRGAFTGAHTSKRGLFQEAHGGTLFLDEIGDMSLPLQGKLLRVLQDHQVRPVGAVRAEEVDARIIAATNRDLKRRIEEKLFRNDLYYRLNVIPIRIPPLRERPEDIPLLAQAFMRKHGGPDASMLSQAAIDLLARQPWEGNARELENSIERALALSGGRAIQPEDLLFQGVAPAAKPQIEEMLDEALRRRLTVRDLTDLYVERALAQSGGRKLKAANVLGLSRRTLYRRETRGPGGETPRSSH
jgi:two-component system response regulator PilR (NtrC family)/two-component system response regulator HydG